MKREFGEISDREKFIQEQLDKLFTTSLDLPEEERRGEMRRILLETEKIIERQKEEGKGKIKATVQETFEQGRIEKPAIDRYFYLIPRQEGGRMVVLTDLHGETKALKKAVKEFLRDEKIHLASLGDVVAVGPEQIQTLEILLKLHNQYPDRVHILRGNCEIDIFPSEGGSEQIYEAQRMPGWRVNMPRALRVFRKLPVGIVTENRVVLVHGCLPRPVKEKDELHYRNLEEINSFSDFIGDPTKFEGREIRRMLWGDIDTSKEEGYSGERFYVSGREDINGQLRAVGAKVLIRGHQKGLLKKQGGGVVIGPDKNVATFHCGRVDDKRIARVPLDKEIEELREEMFEKVE